MNKIKIFGDVLLNIVASALPVIMLQLLVFPFLAKDIDTESYGLMIAIYSLLNIIPAAIGTTLNNIRLLHDSSYRKLNIEGDFNILTFAGSIISIIGMILGFIYLNNEFNIWGILVFSIVSIEMLVHDYLIAEFRIKLNFKLILMDRIVLSLGFLLGLFLFTYTNIWYLPFLIGYTANLIFALRYTSLWKESNRKTTLFSFITKESTYFLISTLLLRLTTYADKLLLYPLLGGNAVSIYYAATILSKVISLAITPLNSVMLSYLSKISNKPNQLFWKTFYASLVICITGYFVSVFVSESLLTLFYPMFKNEAVQYVYITSATTSLNVLASIIQPFVLKYASMKFQIFINFSDVVLYTIMSLFLLTNFGLVGFCIGVMLSRVVKVIILLLVYLKTDVKILDLNEYQEGV
ncbi:lipopolysaccharide biosynthesis protein [Aerococcus urinaeequi]|uniref:lipopolysaccharide biosynthesis protein n=1 Tax=Aerococcus urinaeequi TaxID=51665 RepID=UPI0022E669D9|nr:oligosaccharide flippase family protein [Aerococcus urinaeequi]